MTTVPTNNAKAIAAQLMKRMQAASPNQGFGGLGAWPNESNPTSEELHCELSGFVFNWAAKFAYGEGNARKEIPAFSLQAFYVWNEDPSGTPLHWKGAPAVVPINLTGLPKNQLDRARIAEERVQGQIVGLLGVKYDNIADAETAINKLLADAKAAGTGVFVRVYKKHEKRPGTGKNQGKTFIDKEDFIREVIGGNAPTAGEGDGNPDNSAEGDGSGG